MFDSDGPSDNPTSDILWLEDNGMRTGLLTIGRGDGMGEGDEPSDNPTMCGLGAEGLCPLTTDEALGPFAALTAYPVILVTDCSSGDPKAPLRGAIDVVLGTCIPGGMGAQALSPPMDSPAAARVAGKDVRSLIAIPGTAVDGSTTRTMR